MGNYIKARDSCWTRENVGEATSPSMKLQIHGEEKKYDVGTPCSNHGKDEGEEEYGGVNHVSISSFIDLVNCRW